jgi:Predicted Fe-S-cluster oxidoreductase
MSDVKIVAKRSDLPSFKCRACGSCCRRLDLQASVYKYLDRGDGVCLHFDGKTNLCNIYEERPDICRVDQQFVAFANYLTIRQYLALNYLGCRALRDSLKIEATSSPGSLDQQHSRRI